MISDWLNKSNCNNNNNNDDDDDDDDGDDQDGDQSSYHQHHQQQGKKEGQDCGVITPSKVNNLAVVKWVAFGQAARAITLGFITHVTRVLRPL